MPKLGLVLCLTALALLGTEAYPGRLRRQDRDVTGTRTRKHDGARRGDNDIGDRLFAKFDADRTGQLSLKEFKEMIATGSVAAKGMRDPNRTGPRSPDCAQCCYDGSCCALHSMCYQY